MFCKNCGSEINDNSSFCSSCGSPVEPIITKTQAEPKKAESKALIGALCGFFLGIIGLIIGICLFNNPEERNSFIKGWAIALVVGVVASIVLVVGYYVLIIALAGGTMYI